MSLHLNISNSLSQLADNICMELRQQPGSVFQPQYIVTQTEGMNNWLKLQIADNNGIAANIVFLSPNEIIQKLYYFLGGKFPNMLSAQNLGWLLYSVLGEKDFTRRFAEVAIYYDHEDADSDLKRMALAEKTADLFDQYQIYRPEWIESWNSEKAEDLTDDKWQQYLWARAKELSRQRLPDKTVISSFIREALKEPNNQQKLKAKVPALHLFGLSITTDYHLDLLFKISTLIDVNFHLVNPAPTVYWFDDRSEKQLAFLTRKGLVDKTGDNPGNTLLTSWGRIIQDTFLMLFKNEELLNSFQEVELEEPEPDSLLHKIQQDVYLGASRQEGNHVSLADLKDGSVTISACFTIAREVEVLYNWLVHLVDQQKDLLSPRDIVVMVTDIDAYAPYIKAVFRNAPYQFHFTIADETFVNGDTLVSALTALLKMNRHNFKAEEVLQLLDSGFIRNRFGINDLELIRRLVDAANIRFGITGEIEDDTRFVSWQYGLKRIMYGICISGGKAYTDDSGELLFPIDMVEGNESQQVIRFCHFMQVLIASINERERARTIADWVGYTERLIENLICEPDEEAGEDFSLLQEQLMNFNVADEFMKENISYEIFTHSLLQSVSGAGRSGSFAGGGITFCSLIPMRSIPFKVVAVLGLNFDKFPRRESPASFNLIEKDRRRRGDRNVKENDKHLFLDTLLSAKERLYLSYIGQSTKDNTTIPPSALVDELVDYIEANCEVPTHVRSALTTRHPLQSFSHKYEQSLPGYYNYLNVKTAGVIKRRNQDKNNELFNFEEIALTHFISFFRHPIKAYYNKVLNIYYNEDQVLLSDTEIFNLGSLDKWTLKPKLLTFDAGNIEGLKERLVRTGGLPLKNMAAVAIDEVEKEIYKARELLNQCVANVPSSKVTIELSVNGSTIKGSFDNIYGDKMVFVSYSKKENKYLLEAYIRYLTAIASGFSYELHFISANKETIYTGKVIHQQQAIRMLEELLLIYKQGHQDLIAFFPDFNVKPSDVDDLEEPGFSKMIQNFFHNFNFPCDDQYLLNEYQNGYFKTPGVYKLYKEYAGKLIKPLAELFPGYFEKS